MSVCKSYCGLLWLLPSPPLLRFNAAVSVAGLIGHIKHCVDVQGLKRTIACMDEEHPRTEASINNRSHLRQILNMEGLYRKNKVSLGAGGWLCRWTLKLVADFSVIAGSERPFEDIAGDYCKVSHQGP